MLVKKAHYRPVPKDAEIIVRKDQKLARWTNSRGTTHTRPLNGKGDRIVCESREWYVRLKRPGSDEFLEWKAYTDKTASQALEIELLAKLERGDVGINDPHEEHRKKPLATHLDDYEAHLEGKGNSREHVELTMQRCRSVLVEGIKAKTIADITPGRVEACLADYRRTGLPLPPESKRKPKPLSLASSNHYWRAVRSFGRWLVKDRRASENPVGGMSALKVAEKDKKRRRRALSSEEFQKLIATASGSEVDFRGLAGKDRAMLYLVAGHTGLRVSELASLTPGSFALGTEPPTVCCSAAYTKNGEEAVLPLRVDLVAMLRPWLADKPKAEPVWPGTWAKKASAKMLRLDLEAAGIDYKDASDRFADFHSLRHTFISNLARSGVHPRMAQALARHSKIDLTMNVYTHMVIGDLASAVESLPAIAGAQTETVALAATGTDGPADDGARRRTKWRNSADSPSENVAGPGDGWPKRLAGEEGGAGERKALRVADKDAACQLVASRVKSEADGIRTRNHRIDSPVL